MTRRYVRNWTMYGQPRTRTSEKDLTEIIRSICAKKREKLSDKERFRLIREDLREEKELKMYMVRALVTELSAQLTKDVPTGKHAEFRAEREESKFV